MHLNQSNGFLKEDRTEDFVKAYNQKRNLILRTIDLFGHVITAVVLVQLFRVPWYLGFWQWLPDVCLLFMWPHGMLTHRWLPEKNPIIVIHKKILHGWLFWGCMSMGALLSMGTNMPKLEKFILANALVHLTIDFFTHEGDFK